MAERLCFIPTYDNQIIMEKVIEFKYYTGFAISQKQKSIKSLHNEIKKIYSDKKILEISSKSEDELGIRLSAFNLKLHNKEIKEKVSIESIFQSSKVFEKGGPYKDLLRKTSLEAKKDKRIKESGDLIYFDYDNRRWNLEPKTMFYDYIYIKALMENKELSDKLLNYDCFTDVEFNHKKSINCQARSAAIFISLKKQNKLETLLNNLESFEKMYYIPSENKQVSLFD